MSIIQKGVSGVMTDKRYKQQYINTMGLYGCPNNERECSRHCVNMGYKGGGICKPVRKGDGPFCQCAL